MANYSYGSNFSGFSTNPWITAMQRTNADPLWGPLTNQMYNNDPSLALDSFLRTIRTSNTNEDLMKRMLPSLKNQWTQRTMNQAQQGGAPSVKPFSSFLSNYDWDRAMARYAPEYRRQSPTRYQRPVRTVTF